MDFQPAKIELIRAQRCIARMEKSSTYEEYDEAWSDFLSRIENTYQKTKAIAQENIRWPGFISPFNKKRKNDELLSYLTQARNSVHHGIAESTKHVKGGLAFNPPPGSTVLRLDSINFDNFGGVTVKSKHPFSVTSIPDRIEVVEVVNRKEKYKVPTTHLGNDLESVNPIDLARLGHIWYGNFLNEAEKFFN
ncbi:hypothetical protein RVV74_001199 [Enterobacter ludwigii]|nr:hypothetical protein [Enterobacter ludwigii]